MKNPGIKIAIALIGMGVLVFFVYQFTTAKKHNWFFTYVSDDKEPYGCYVLSELLKSESDSGAWKVIEDTLYTSIDMDAIPDHSNYVFVGDRMYLDSLELAYILDFVAQGHNAFIASRQFSQSLLDSLFNIPEVYDWEDQEQEITYENHGTFLQSKVDTSIECNLWYEEDYIMEKDHRCYYVRNNKPHYHPWSSFHPEIESVDDADLYYIGYANDEDLNYVVAKHGKGRFYLHSNPEIFTNFQLLDSTGFEYASNIFADLGDGYIIWDEDNRNYQYTGPRYSGTGYTPDEGPLVFILSQPPLRFAWYVLLLGAVLYLFLGARRNERIIPVLARNKNTSIEFSETIGQLYLNKKDHRKICLLKMKLYLTFLRERYRLNTNYTDAQELSKLVKSVSVQSDIDEKVVQTIFDTHSRLKVVYQVEKDLLVKFHRMLEYFYTHCK